MSDSRRRTSVFTFASEGALLALVAGMPWALGGAASWVLWPLVLLSGAAAVLACVGARRQKQQVGLPELSLLMFAGALLCALQLVPLSAGLLRVVSAPMAALREFTLVPLGLEGPRPASLEPSATWRELAKHLSYGVILATAAQLSRSRKARQRVLATVAFNGAALALVGLGHSLFSVSSLFGLLDFTHAAPPLITPFGNPNHLASYLGLAATVSVSLALSAEVRAKAAPYLLAAMLSGAGVLLSLSRGGIAFFVFGQLLLALWAFRRRRQGERARDERWKRGFTALGTLLAVLAVGTYLAVERIAREFGAGDTLNLSKVELWPSMVRAALRFPLLGMGRGAFEVAFTRYQAQPLPNTLTHPENVLLQLAAEWGASGLLLALAGAWAFGRLLRRESVSTQDFGVLAGVAALVLHNLFDFSLELPACALAALVSLGAVSRPDERQGGAWRLPSWHALAGAAACLLVSLASLFAGRHQLRDAEVELQGLLTSKAPRVQVRARGEALIDRHPADYLLYSLVGAAHAAEAPTDGLAFVNRALYLRPLDARAHRAAARSLLTLGRRSQAFLEYRLAYQAGDAASLREGMARARSEAELVTLTPEDAKVAATVAQGLWGVASRREQALTYLAWAREHFAGSPDALKLWLLEAEVRLQRRELPLAAAAAEEAERRAPEALEPRVMRANVLQAGGRAEEALEALNELRSRFPGEVQLGFTLARHQLAAGKPRRARETLQQLSPFVSDFPMRSQLMVLEASCYAKEGLFARALDAYASAARLAPNANHYFAMARIHESQRRFDSALRSLQSGLALLSPDARGHLEPWKQRLEAEARKYERPTERAPLTETERLMKLASEPAQ